MFRTWYFNHAPKLNRQHGLKELEEGQRCVRDMEAFHGADADWGPDEESGPQRLPNTVGETADLAAINSNFNLNLWR
ncbi:hypothetical protein ACLKA6_006019 [Drosophila palustris]